MFRPILASLVVFCAEPVFAGGGGAVVLDGSFGARGALPGPNFIIPASVGKQVGGNLFQSFSQFDLNSTQLATFTGPPNVQNILSRVTSGSASSIDGTVSSTIQGANLFLLNPAGVIFGAHAQINVSGSFAVSTANYLKLADGGKFNTSLGGGDLLTSAPVSAFGFLKAPAGVSLASKGGGIPLTVGPGESFSVVSGDIQINGAAISAVSARISLLSVGSAGEATVSLDNPLSPISIDSFTQRGNITVAAPSDPSDPFQPVALSLSGAGSNLVIKCDKLYIAGQINSSTAQGNALPIDVDAFEVILDGGGIHADTLGSGNGGSILLHTRDLKIINGGQISSSTFGSGDGGTVNVVADTLLIDGAGALVTGIFADCVGSTGNGGSISVQARDLKIVGRGFISSSTADAEPGSSGNGGNVAVQARNLTILDGGEIASRTFGSGNGGEVAITADTLQVSNSFGALNTSASGSGNGGNISVAAKSVTLDNALFIAETRGSGNGGTISVVADTLTLTGVPREVQTGFNADALGSGLGGSIYVKATSIILDDGVFTTDNLGAGNGGNVNVTADSISLDNNAAISAASGDQGAGGTVYITANVLQLDFARISATAFSSGAAGSVQMNLGTLSMDSGSLISSANTGSGQAGSVIIDTTGQVKLGHGSSISAASALGDAGDIELNSDGIIRLKDASSITASAGVNGGNIHITAPELVYLIDSSVTATAGSTGKTGTGGNIRIDPRFIVANNSLISANATVGTDGNVELISDFLFTSNSQIFATGTVSITAPALDLGAELIALPNSLLSAEGQLQERCTALLQGDFSSFITVGRGGTEPPPDELQTTF